MSDFDKDFLFGVATASYQVEGAYNEDGRSMSIWDTFCRQNGKVYKDHNGDVACDHYHLYKDDVKMMKDLGIEAYRFSIAWPRIFPEKGHYNPKGIDFYKRLTDELLKNDIKPFVTIYHWDLPQWADDLGGWLNREVVDWFGEYASKLFNELGGYIKNWITLNEPWCSSFLSYFIGEHAPGHKDLGEAVLVSHNLLLAHGKAVEIFRDINSSDSKIGITLNLNEVFPATDSPEDKAAARIADGFQNRWFLDPIFKGEYPKDMLELFGKYAKTDFITDGDLKRISQKLDFLGVNYYTRAVVKKGNDGILNAEQTDVYNEKTEMGWEVYPESLYNILMRLKNEYTFDLPLYITENGAAYKDVVSEDGRVHDEKRIEFLKKHFKQAKRFIDDGGKLRGYFVWSLMDNFEWAHGYSKRFGIVYVDYETEKRILKDSALWYKNLISTRTI
ncbi:GH1 family beta-glucosidase [Thermoanaerobacterium thermosaccharolyticum]|uniref:GH1 family beta-glucosidase n=1 Tax=Thermoanaerobacterium thermosaccharolyticum TaxID=1517 RepID=UPI003DA966D8